MQNDQKANRIQSSKEMGGKCGYKFQPKKKGGIFSIAKLFWECNGAAACCNVLPQDFSRCKGLALRGGDGTKVDMIFNSKELQLQSASGGDHADLMISFDVITLWIVTDGWLVGMVGMHEGPTVRDSQRLQCETTASKRHRRSS